MSGKDANDSMFAAIQPRKQKWFNPAPKRNRDDSVMFGLGVVVGVWIMVVIGFTIKTILILTQ